MASLDVGGFCSWIKKSNYLPRDFSHTTTIRHRMQIPKKPKILFVFPVLHSKAILLQVVIFFHNNAKKPWFKEWRIAFRRKRINQKRHQMFQISGEKKHHLKLLNIARIEETCIHLA